MKRIFNHELYKYDADLDPIRHTEAYQRLMEEYFNEYMI